MQTRTARLLGPAATLAIGALLLPLSLDAAAFPPDRNNCRDNDVDYVFTDDWSAAEQGWAEEGIDDLFTVRDRDGTLLVEHIDTDPIDIDFQDNGVGNRGSAECDFPNATIWVSSNALYLGEADFYRGVARHEMGHLIGLQHSTYNASHSFDDPPTMSTCREANDYIYNWSQDDNASITWNWSTNDAEGDESITPNAGFEQGASWWGYSNGTGVGETLGGVDGPGRLRWTNIKSPAATPYVYQTADISAGNDALNQSFNFWGAFYQPNAAYFMSANIQLYSRSIVYTNDPNNSNDCDYPYGLDDGIDVNSQAVAGLYVLERQTGTIVSTITTWWSMGITGEVIGPTGNPSASMGWELQLRALAVSYQNAPNKPKPMYIDDLHLASPL